MVDFSQKPKPVAKKVEQAPIVYMNEAKDAEIRKLNKRIGDLMKENEELKFTTPELDIDGFQKWVKTLNPTEHIEKTLIIQMQKYGKSAFLAYFKSLYQKYQKK